MVTTARASAGGSGRPGICTTTDRASVIGTYSVGLTGDTSNTLFGAYRVEDAALVRGRAIDTAEG
jgi:hypothetical protein